MRATGAVDAVAPAIIAPVALQNTRSRRTEARVSLYAAGDGFDALRLDALAPGAVYLNPDAAEKLAARPGDTLRVLAGARTATVRVAEIVAHDGNGGDGAAVMLPLARAQTLLGVEDRVRFVLVSNRGDETSGAALTGPRNGRGARRARAPGRQARRARARGPAGRRLHVDLHDVRVLFSIVAGVLPIFLIFVMLSAERRTELGIARAIGTRREHVVQMFVFEGLAYDLGAAAGALPGRRHLVRDGLGAGRRARARPSSNWCASSRRAAS